MSADASDVWRQIPPEEKFELMARAHSKGIGACLITIIVLSTMAVGLHLSWLMWASLLIAPFIFQFSAGKAWRSLRPRIMLEYLAARSAARRYAFSNAAKNLELAFMFRGEMERQFDVEQAQEALEAAISDNKEAEVWVALFKDAVVMMSEDVGGARCQFAHVINDKLTCESRSNDAKDYSSGKEIILSYVDKKDSRCTVKLTSRYPAALVVFEKKLGQLREELREAVPKLASPDELLEVTGEDA